MPARISRRGVREAGGAWTPAAIAAAWDREDVARAVAEIEDAAAALRWGEMDRAPPSSPWPEAERRQPQVWLGVGSLWASIAAVAVGMVGGLVLLMR